ncbi:Ger(x)C family spore germination protein [Mycoplasmatota bacterium]|nr:Ger(x)C family spore germination protein [Mycoplasmatota bacterium]
MKHCIKRYLLLPIFCMILICLTGCWDNRDITELSVVSAVGIDKTDDDQIEVTIQIIKIGTVKAKEQGSSDEAYWSISKTGNTIFEALRNILTTVDRKPFYTYNELIVIGEDIAKEGIMEVLDFFERDHENRRQALVLIAKGLSAKEVLNAKTELSTIPSLHLLEVIRNSQASTKIIEVELFDLLRDVCHPGKNAVVGIIEKIDNEKEELKIKNLRVAGGAVFTKDKLQAWLKPKDTIGYLIITNELKNGIINIPDPTDENKLVSVELKRVKNKIEVKFKDNKPTFLLEIKAAGNIGEQQSTSDLTTKEMVKKLDKEIEKLIEDELKKIIKLAQEELENDIFGLGAIVHMKNLNYWKKVENDWDSVFSETQIEIKVDAKLKAPGTVKKALEPK